MPERGAFKPLLLAPYDRFQKGIFMYSQQFVLVLAVRTIMAMLAYQQDCGVWDA